MIPGSGSKSETQPWRDLKLTSTCKISGSTREYRIDITLLQTFQRVKTLTLISRKLELPFLPHDGLLQVAPSDYCNIRDTWCRNSECIVLALETTEFILFPSSHAAILSVVRETRSCYKSHVSSISPQLQVATCRHVFMQIQASSPESPTDFYYHISLCQVVLLRRK
jgi:hypothetical protein